MYDVFSFELRCLQHDSLASLSHLQSEILSLVECLPTVLYRKLYHLLIRINLYPMLSKFRSFEWNLHQLFGFFVLFPRNGGQLAGFGVMSSGMFIVLEFDFVLASLQRIWDR